MAADRIYTAQMRMTADVSEAKTQLENLQSSINSLLKSSATASSSPGQKLKADFQDALSTVNQLKATLKESTNINTGNLDILKFSQSLNKTGMSLSKYAQQLSALGPTGKQVFADLAQSVSMAEIPLKKTNTLMQNFATTMKNTIKWQLSSNILHGFMGALQTSYGYAQDLNASLNDIRIVSGQSTEQMAKFAVEANKAAKALSSTTNDYAKASLIYYQQGLNDAQVKARTDITTKMANVTKESAQQVSDYMTAVWNNFDDGSKSLEYYADVMTALGAATASSTDEIATGLEKFAAVAETVGLSYEYATSALATITAETRQNADIVGNALKTLFSRIQGLNLGETLDDGTTLNKYSQALDKIGIDIKDANGEIKDMDVILNELGNKWGTLSKDTQIATAQTVAGVRQYTQLIALMDNWGTFQENLNTALTSTGELDRQAEIYAESWEASGKRVRAAAEGVWDSIMDEDFFIGVNNTLEDTLSIVEKLINALGGMPGIIALIGSGMLKHLGPSMTNEISRLLNNLPLMTGGAQKTAIRLRKEAATELANFDGASMTASDALNLEYLQYASGKRNQWYEDLNSGKITKDQYNYLNAGLSSYRTLNQEAMNIENQLNTNMESQAALLKRNRIKSEEQYLQDGRQSFLKAAFQRKYAEGKGVSNEAYFNMAKSNKNLLQGNELQAFKDANKAIKEINASTDDNATKTQKLNAVYSTFRNTIKKSGKDIKTYDQYLQDLSDSSQKNQKAVQEYQKLLKREKELKNNKYNLQENMVSARESLDNKDYENLGVDSIQAFAEGTTQVFQGSMRLGIGLSSIKAAIQALQNEDLSFFDKFTSVLTSTGFAIPSITNGIELLRQGVQNLGMAFKTGLIPQLLASNLGIEVHNAAEAKALIASTQLAGAKIVLGQVTYDLSNKQNLENAAKAMGIDVTNELTEAELRLAIAKKMASDKNGEFDQLFNRGIKDIIKRLGLGAAKILAVVAAVAALVAVVKHFQDTSIDGQIKRTNKSIEEMGTALSDAKNEAEELVNVFNNYNSIVDKLESCTKGTKEYRDALYEANQAAIELLQKHPEIASKKGAVKYTDDRVIITEEGQEQILKDQENAVLSLTYGSYSLQQNLRDLQIQQQEKRLEKDSAWGYTGYDSNSDAQIQQARLVKGLVESMYEDEYFNETNFKQKYNNALRVNGLGENLLDLDDVLSYAENLYNSNKDLQNAIEENTFQTKIENDNITRQALGEDAENMSEDEIRVTSNLMDQAKQDIVDSIIEGKNFTGKEGSKDGINRWSTANDEQVKALWQRYMTAIDEDYQLASNPVRGNDTNRTFAYIGADNKVAEVSIKTMANAIAAAEALEKLGEYTNKAAETLALFDQNAGAAADGLRGYIANQNFSTMTQKDFEFMKSEISNAGSLKGYYRNLFGDQYDTKMLELANALGFEGDTAIADYLSQQLKIINGQTSKFNNTGKSKYSAVTNAIQTERYSIEEGHLAGYTWYENAGWYKEFDENVQSQITTSLENAFELTGQNGIEKLQEVLSTLDPDDMESFLKIYNDFDWKNGSSEEFIALLEESGVNIHKNKKALYEFADAADEAGDKLPIDDLDTLIKKLGEVLELIGDINLGDIVDQETIDKLRAAGIEVENFFNKAANGKWMNTRELSPEEAIEFAKNEVAKKGNVFNSLGLNATGEMSYKDYITGESVKTSYADYKLNQTEAALKKDDLSYYKQLIEKGTFAGIGEEESIAIFGDSLESVMATLAGTDSEAIKALFNKYRQFLVDGIAGGYTEEAINEEGMLAAAEHEDSTIHTLNNQEDFKNADGSFTEKGVGTLKNFAASREKYHDAYQDYLDTTKDMTDTQKAASGAAEELERRIKAIDANEAAQSIGKLIEELKDLPEDSENFNNAIGEIQTSLETVFGKNFISEDQIKEHLSDIKKWTQGLITSEDLFYEVNNWLNTQNIELIPNINLDNVIEAFNNLDIEQKELILKLRGEADLTTLAQQLLATGANAQSVATILAAIGQVSLDDQGFAEMMTALQKMALAMQMLEDGVNPAKANSLLEEAKSNLSTMGFNALVPGDVDPNMETFNNGGVSNGYDYSGGGGGGSSGSDKTGKEQLQDKQRELYEKKRDLLSTKRENMNPEDASKYIKEEIALLEKEQKILEKQIKSWKVLMKEKVEEFNEKYPEFEIKLTDDGEIANLADIYAAMEAKYDELMATKGIDHAEEWHKEMMEALDLPVGLQENIDENVALLAQKEKEQAELALQEITDRIDWRVKQIDFEIKKLNYYQEKLLIQAHGNKQTIEAMLEGFKYQEQEMLQLFEKGAALRQGIDELKAAKAQYPGNEQIFDEAILDYQNDLVDLNLDILKLRQEMEELVQNVLDLALDEMDIQNERIEKYIGMLDHFQNIIDLSGRALIDQGTKVQIGAMKVETLINRMSIAKQKMEGLTEATNLAQQALEKRKADGDETSVKFWENQVEVLKREMEAATEEFLGDWEAALQAAGELFEMRVELAVQTMSDALSPFSSMELFQSNYEKEKQIQEQYLDDATRLYELNKLNRDLNKNIQDQNDLLARYKLRDIQEEILALQKAGVEMSQYDLDVLQKKYDIRLAEIALMEAQNSKTSMRLIRDAGGNWTYAYDADEEKIEDATQKYEDAVYALDKLAKEYVNDVSDQLIANKQEFLEALADLDRNASDYQDQLLILQEQYMERERYLLDELRKGADETGLAFHETLYGQMTDLKDYEDAYNQFVNNSDVTIAELMTNYKDWQKVVEQAMNVAGTSWEDFGTDMDGTLMSLEEHIQALCEEISELVDVLMGYVAEAIGMVEEWQSKYSKRVDQELAMNEAAFSSGLGGGGVGQADYTNLMRTDWHNLAYQVSNGATEVTDYAGNVYRVEDFGSAEALIEKLGATREDKLTLNKEYGEKIQHGHGPMDGVDFTDEETEAAHNTETDKIVADALDRLKKASSGATGMYTGSWPISEGMSDREGGKFAILHQKELVLNQQDTKNILDAVKMTRSQNLNKSIDDKVQQMLDWSNDKFSRLIREVQLPIHDIQPIEQKVEIMAEFPGVTDQYEIREALSNLSNDASQYLNIKRSLY